MLASDSRVDQIKYIVVCTKVITKNASIRAVLWPDVNLFWDKEVDKTSEWGELDLWLCFL